jgi:hypothetical protein
MEFNYIVDFFSSLNYLKRKYPMIVTYVSKYLKNLDEDGQAKEVENVSNFLIQNPEIKNRKFTNPDFKTGKQSLVLAMDNFLFGTEEQVNLFWEKLIEVENILFPNGKPITDSSVAETQETENCSPGVKSAMSLLETSPVFSDIIDQVKATAACMGNNVDINSIMEMPDFKKIIESIKFGLMSGKYKLKDLTTTVGNIINSVQDDLDEETRNNLKTVIDNIDAVERGEQPNISNLINVVSKIKNK